MSQEVSDSFEKNTAAAADSAHQEKTHIQTELERKGVYVGQTRPFMIDKDNFMDTLNGEEIKIVDIDSDGVVTCKFLDPGLAWINEKHFPNNKTGFVQYGVGIGRLFNGDQAYKKTDVQPPEKRPATFDDEAAARGSRFLTEILMKQRGGGQRPPSEEFAGESSKEEITKPEAIVKLSEGTISKQQATESLRRKKNLSATGVQTDFFYGDNGGGSIPGNVTIRTYISGKGIDRRVSLEEGLREIDEHIKEIQSGFDEKMKTLRMEEQRVRQKQATEAQLHRLEELRHQITEDLSK